MIIKERVYEKCPKCGSSKFVSDEEYGCDSCKKKIDLSKPDSEYLRATVFYDPGGKTQDFQFCSWKCVLKKLRRVKSNYFINLPHLHFDHKKPGLRACDFFKLLK